MVAGNYDIQISVLSVILKCEWGLSVSQEALITSVSLVQVEPGTCSGKWLTVSAYQRSTCLCVCHMCGFDAL